MAGQLAKDRGTTRVLVGQGRRLQRRAAWLVLAMALLTLPTTAAAEEPQRVRIDIREVPLLELTLFFSDLTGQNFVLLDKDLADKRITIYAPQPVTIEVARELFITALRLHGLVVVDDGAYWKVTRESLGSEATAAGRDHAAYRGTLGAIPGKRDRRCAKPMAIVGRTQARTDKN